MPGSQGKRRANYPDPPAQPQRPPGAAPPKPRAPFAPWDRRQLPGAFDVEESARRVGNYKWVEMKLFEALGGGAAPAARRGRPEPEAPHLTIEKLVGVFRVLIPHKIAAYTYHLNNASEITDAPTMR